LLYRNLTARGTVDSNVEGHELTSRQATLWGGGCGVCGCGGCGVIVFEHKFLESVCGSTGVLLTTGIHGGNHTWTVSNWPSGALFFNFPTPLGSVRLKNKF
jgi:hypothetical protein